MESVFFFYTHENGQFYTFSSAQFVSCPSLSNKRAKEQGVTLWSHPVEFQLLFFLDHVAAQVVDKLLCGTSR